ncbi:hypothetical protein [Wenzhouxiangella sp. EGI_FJ10409]
MPVLAATSIATEVSPELLMVPAALMINLIAAVVITAVVMVRFG